ncbi:MAG: hypothetical protein GTO44_09960 [Hydrotalea flava]|nr:hypothetical protein [Hydrotalea flava]
MVVPAAVFTFVMFTQFGTARIALQVLAMALFIGLSVLHAGGFGVSSEQTTTMLNPAGNPVGSNVSQIIIIPDGEDASWLSYIYAALAIFNITSLFREKVFNVPNR